MFERQIERLQRYILRLEGVDRRFFWARLWTFTGSAALALVAFALLEGVVRWLSVAAALIAFGFVVHLHRRVDRQLARSRISLALSQAQHARLHLAWAAIPHAPLPPPPAGHPFEADLNLTGERSIHRLIDTAISLGGSRRLQEWLLQPVPDIDQIIARQAIVQEMIPLAGFRHKLAVNSALVSSQHWEGERLLEWLSKRPPSRPLLPWLALLGGLALVNTLLFVLNAMAVLPPWWIATLSLYALLYLSRYKDFEDMFDEAYDLVEALNQFKAVLLYLERYPCRAGSRLAALCQPYQGAERRPSAYLQRIAGIASAASLRGNPFVWLLLNTLGPWDMFFAHLLNRAKRDVAQLLPSWLDTWYELEALNSLANFAYLNPGSVFPRLQAPGSGEPSPVFSARQLGHPLIPAGDRVANDFTLDHLGQVVVVTGSNMSGKSTFLRTLGVNLALAQIGAPVIGESLQLMPFRLFTSMNLSDSLSDGISFFYAEVKRLKRLLHELQTADSLPLFFLIDEIFRGTNNRERAIGSRSYVQAVAGERGVGVISTHDLELAHLEQAVEGIHNYHFREDVVGDRMVFDYRLRPGPSPTTNALKIMQLEGLPVQPSPADGTPMGEP